MLKAILFDFDGTIADTLPICFYAFQAVFKDFDNKECTTDEIKAMFGPSETGIIIENLQNKNHHQAIEHFYKKYDEKHSENNYINEEIKELFQHLKKENYKLGIVTGKARRSLNISLKYLHMENMFDVIITGDDVDMPKPHPEGIYKALEQLGISGSEAIFLGDSDADIQAGIQAGVFTIGVQWLPNYQTSEFTFQPKLTFYSVSKFKEALVKEEILL